MIVNEFRWNDISFDDTDAVKFGDIFCSTLWYIETGSLLQ